MRQSGPDILLKSKWSPWTVLFALVLLGAFSTAFLFGGWQDSRLNCRRAQVGQAPDCTLINRAAGGLFAEEIRLKGVQEIAWAEPRGRTKALRALEINSLSGRHRLGLGASSMNSREKHEAVRIVSGYLQASNDLGEFQYELSLVNAMAWMGAGALAFALFLFWATLSSRVFPARIRSTSDGSALWIRRSPGQMYGTRVALEEIRDVRVVGGREAIARVFPRIARVFGNDLNLAGPSEHGHSALVIRLESGREVVVPNWVPTDRLLSIARELRAYLGMREEAVVSVSMNAAPVDAPAPGNVFTTGHPRLHQIGQGIVAVTALALFGWVIVPMSFFRLIPSLGISVVVYLLARELMSSQEITVDPPMIRVRRKALRGFSNQEERVSSFSRIEFRERAGDEGSWFRGVLVHPRGGRASVMFAQGRERAEVLRQCERMAELTGLSIQGGNG